MASQPRAGGPRRPPSPRAAAASPLPAALSRAVGLKLTLRVSPCWPWRQTYAGSEPLAARAAPAIISAHSEASCLPTQGCLPDPVPPPSLLCKDALLRLHACPRSLCLDSTGLQADCVASPPRPRSSDAPDLGQEITRRTPLWSSQQSPTVSVGSSSAPPGHPDPLTPVRPLLRPTLSSRTRC